MYVYYNSNTSFLCYVPIPVVIPVRMFPYRVLSMITITRYVLLPPAPSSLLPDCGLICHQHCVESVPNSCGLPLELAEHVHTDQQQPSPKKARTTTTTAGEKKKHKSPLKKPGGQKPSGKASDTDTHDGGRTPTGESSKRKPLKEKMAGVTTPQLIISQTSGTETPPGVGVDRGSLKRSKRNEAVEGAMRQPPPDAVVKKLAVAGRDADRENVDGGQISVGFDGSRVVKSGRISTSK